MQAFTQLYRAIDETTKTNEKIAAMQAYFMQANAADAAWAVYFLSGQKLQRLVKTNDLRAWAAELANIPLWLLEESYEWVGDLGETLAAVIDQNEIEVDGSLADWVEHKLKPLKAMPPEEQKVFVCQYWQQMTSAQRFVLNKLITGSLRVGVSQKLLVRAVSAASTVPIETIAHRLMGNWKPTPQFYSSLTDPSQQTVADFQPYPFCLANQVEGQVESLGRVDEYIAEWKWDGIRAQVIRRGGQLYIWSRGEDRLEERYPELASLAMCVPDGTVLDGEILGWKDDRPLSFADLQRRIGRKTVGKKLLAEVPVNFVAFDLLEYDGVDQRQQHLKVRRGYLEQIVSQASCPVLQASRTLAAADWQQLGETRQQCRELGSEGLMLKHVESVYSSGRVRGTWWKWKIEPYTIDAVLTAAQRGHGRRASLYTDYTFSLWKDGALIPFAKAYSGLTDAELRKVDNFVRRHTLERYGPVRSVAPELVMEIAFENIQVSKRHKSGIAVRFPRILRWRTDKSPADANTLEQLIALADLKL